MKEKIYECFPFFNELDLLKIKLSELSDSVDYFVICESTRTHSGKRKPLYYLENKFKFKKWESKIVYLVYNPPKFNPIFSFFDYLAKFNFMNSYFFGRIYAIFGLGRWRIEHKQRNYLKTYLKKHAQDKDLIVISDADEIMNKKILPKAKSILKANPKKVIVLKQKVYNYYLNGLLEHFWCSEKICTWKKLKRTRSLNNIRNWNSFQRVIKYFFKINFLKRREIFLNSGGWHFSYLGNSSQIKTKLKNISHYEIDTKEKNSSFINDKIQSNNSLINNNSKIKYVPIDNSFPEEIQKNPNNYKNLIKKI